MKKFIPLIITTFISITLLSLDITAKVKTSNFIGRVVFSIYYDVVEIVPRLSNLKAENQRLHKELTKLSYKNTQLKEAQLENIKLRKLLDFKQRTELEMTPAEVIGLDYGRFANSIVIDKGEDEGLSYNDPVVTYQGIVGKIIEALPTKSIVQPLYDRNCRVSVLIQKNRTFGILVWESGENLSLKGIPIYADVRENDLVISSGLGGIFPKGFNVGTVDYVTPEPTGLFLEVSVRPTADFSKLEHVLVITGAK